MTYPGTKSSSDDFAWITEFSKGINLLHNQRQQNNMKTERQADAWTNDEESQSKQQWFPQNFYLTPQDDVLKELRTEHVRSYQ
ncbi:hypothetical protein H8959_011965 [Pygathrix nigripes]